MPALACLPFFHPALLTIGPSGRVRVAEFHEVSLQRQVSQPGVLVPTRRFLADCALELFHPQARPFQPGAAEIYASEVAPG